MSELKTHLSQQLGETQSKYTYFLMAIAASGIALSVQRTTGRSLSSGLILLGLSVASWGLSFFAGCRNRAYFSSTLYANLTLLQLKDGTHPEAPNHPDAVVAASEGVRQAANHNSSMANFWGKMQFRLLVLGGVLFIAWHVLEMSSVKSGIISDPNQSLQETPLRVAS